MKTNNNIGAYPYLSVLILFAGLGSIVGGLIAELGLFLGMRILRRLVISHCYMSVCLVLFLLY